VDCFLGIDLGTSRVKAAVFDSQGQCLGSGQAELARLDGYPLGRHFHDPVRWWDNAVTAAREALAKLDPTDELKAIACCGFHHVPVFLNADGEPAMPVVMMHDRELPAFRQKLEQDGRLEMFHETTRSLVSDSHLPSIAEAARSMFGREWRTIRHVMLGKDYLRYRLTGRIGTEYCDATGTNLIAADESNWSPQLCDCLGIDVEWLPQIARSTDLAAELVPDAAEALGAPAGVPVFYGGGDSHCAMLGLGCIEPGDSAVLLGTNCTLRTVFDKPTYDSEIRIWRQQHVVPDRWTVSASSLAGASVIEWAHNVLAAERPGATSEGKTESACAKGLYFLPFIHGERCPFHDSKATGSFQGLRSFHTSTDMLQAVKEGVSFTFKMCWEIVSSLTSADGGKMACPVVSGGGSGDRGLVQLIANVLAGELRCAQGSWAGCLGAAMLAGVGSGAFADCEEAVRRAAANATPVAPSPVRSDELEPCYTHFRGLVERFKQNPGVKGDIP